MYNCTYMENFNLTLKQEKFFENLKELYGSKALASYGVMKEKFGFKSKNSIKQYIEVLRSKGLIEEIEGNLYINPSEFGAKFVLSKVKAGFASIMDDKIEQRISLDKILDINSPSTFVFKVSGDSMMGIGILDGDYVIIKKTPSAEIGDVVLAVVDNEFTLKTYKKDSKGYYLQPENPDYPIIRPKLSLTIFGVALGITRKIK